MTIYQKLSAKLQRISIADFACMKWIYLILGILMVVVYPPLLTLSIWVYVISGIVAALPLLLLTLGFDGNLLEKAQQYLRQNNPSNQVLTIISCFNFGIVLAMLIPYIASFVWGYYLGLMVLLAIKPASVILFNHKESAAKK